MQTKQVILVRHGPTSATERGAIGADEPLVDRKLKLVVGVPDGAVVLSSPALRCRQTALAVGLAPAIDPDLRECDFGDWTGRLFSELDPAGVDAWLADPDSAPHGGESLRMFAARVQQWLDGAAPATVAFTHAGVIRAALVAALGAPLASFWRISVAPLSIVELQFGDSGWAVSL